MLKSRRYRLQSIFEADQLDLLLIEHPVNLHYLAGFTGSEGSLLLSLQGGWFICDSRYTTQARDEVSGFEVVEYPQRMNRVAELVQQASATRLGFEAVHTSFQNHQKLHELLPGVELVPIGPELDEIRSSKDGLELQKLEEVATLSSESLLSCLPLLQPGIKETEFALQLEFEMRRKGAEGRSFDFIVASGERGAMPHGRASDKLIRSGELVTIDYGAIRDGYCSDETVTVAIGNISQKQQQIYQTVLEAHDLAVAAVRPGISCKDLDAIARDHIKAQGFGEYFGHGLGHGVGLEIHEKPTVSPKGETVLEQGMVITIEPGIYLPGIAGVRIEDMVAVTTDGCKVLTKVPKQLKFL